MCPSKKLGVKNEHIFTRGFQCTFGKVYFVIVISNIDGQKMRLSASSQRAISEKPIFGHFEVSFSMYKFFPRAGVISCYHIQRAVF